MANITDDNGAIQTGLRADIMRKSMENKNLLSSKGSIYVGTGDTNNVVVSGSTVSIPKTAALTVGNQNEVLSVGANNTLQYSKITPDMMSSSTDTYNITCTTALSANQAISATTASYSEWATFSGNADSSGPDTSATIYNKFQTASSSMTSIEQKITNIETMMNQGDQLVNKWGIFKFSIIVDGRERDIAGITFSPYTSVRYYNSCFLEGIFNIGSLPEESSSSFNAEYEAFSRFYKNGEVIEIVGALNDKVNFLPAQDIEFYFASPNVYVNYSERIHSDYSDSVLWCNIKIYPTYILKIKTNGNISLQVLPLFVSQDSSSHSSLGYDYYELRKHDDAVHGTLETIKIGYIPKINS